MIFKTPKFWQKINLLSLSLLPISLLYFIAYQIKKKFTKNYISTKPIICIGNIIAGGSGKTPITIDITKIIQKIIREQQPNKDVAIITTGYGTKIKESIFLENTNEYSNIGDEAKILIKTAPIFIGKNRNDSVKKAEKEDNLISLVLDDGMQSYNLHKDLQINVIDSQIMFGNCLLIPAGPLRETIKSGLKKTDILISIGKLTAEQMANINKYYRKDIIFAKITISNQEIITRKPTFAFAGIAYPNKFFNLLKANNCNLVETKTFPDHYKYSQEELLKLIKTSKNNNWQIITTEKDWVKFPCDIQKTITPLLIEARFSKESENLIRQKLELIINSKLNKLT